MCVCVDVTGQSEKDFFNYNVFRHRVLSLASLGRNERQNCLSGKYFEIFEKMYTGMVRTWAPRSLRKAYFLN